MDSVATVVMHPDRAAQRGTPVAFLNRTGQRLFGILHRPSHRLFPHTAILLLSPGVKMRVAPHRLYVKMANRFTSLGYTVLRFDFHGLGDAEGDAPETHLADLYRATQNGRYVDDTIDAMDWLQQHHGVSTFVAGGLCGGALTGLLAAQRDRRIARLLALSIPVILDGSDVDATSHMSEGQLRQLRESYLTKLRPGRKGALNSLIRFVTFQSDYRLLVRSLLGSRPRARMASSPEPLDNANPEFAPAFRSLVETSRPMLLVFAETDRLWSEFQEKFVARHREWLERSSGSYRIHVTPRANHVFSFAEWQDDLLHTCVEWLNDTERRVSEPREAAQDGRAVRVDSPPAQPGARPVRILYCEGNVDRTIGGSYYSLLYLVTGLDRSRFEPVVVFYGEHPLLSVFRQAGVATEVWRRLPPFTFGSEVRPFLRWCQWALILIQKGGNLFRQLVLPGASRIAFIRRHGIEMVHLNNSVQSNQDWMLAARLTGIPCLTHQRGMLEHCSGFTRYFGRRLDAVVCISEAVRRNLEAFGIDRGHLVTIHNGLDPAVMRVKHPTAVRSTHDVPEDAPLLVMLGNIKPWKGQDTLIRAVDLVRKQTPDVRCLLVGDTSPDDREYEVEIRRLVSSLGLERHVMFAGFQLNVTDYLMAADIVVHTSVLPEPFGRVLLEAMACRKPVIAARAGAIPEIVREGVTGLTVPPGDPCALATGIAHLVSHPDEARRMGQNGYEHLLKDFHISRNVEATQRLYETLLHASR